MSRSRRPERWGPAQAGRRRHEHADAAPALTERAMARSPEKPPTTRATAAGSPRFVLIAVSAGGVAGPRHRAFAGAGLSRHPERRRRRRAGRARSAARSALSTRTASRSPRPISRANGTWCSSAIPIARTPARRRSTSCRWRSTSSARRRTRSASSSSRSTRSATRRTMLKSYVASFDAPIVGADRQRRRGQAGGQGLPRLLRQAPAQPTATTTWTTAPSST